MQSIYRTWDIIYHFDAFSSCDTFQCIFKLSLNIIMQSVYIEHRKLYTILMHFKRSLQSPTLSGQSPPDSLPFQTGPDPKP
jgi:hypothetical protein